MVLVLAQLLRIKLTPPVPDTFTFSPIVNLLATATVSVPLASVMSLVAAVPVSPEVLYSSASTHT